MYFCMAHVVDCCEYFTAIHLLACRCCPAGPYLVLGTSHRQVGSIEGHRVHELTGHEIIPFVNSTLHLSQSQVAIAKKQHSEIVPLLRSLRHIYHNYLVVYSHTHRRCSHCCLSLVVNDTLGLFILSTVKRVYSSGIMQKAYQHH